MSTKRVPTKARVSRVLDLTPTVRELVLEFEAHQPFEFRAGQFLMLHVPQEPKPALRAYSIASDDRSKTKLRLLFKHVANGVASTFVWTLKGGELLDVTGPFGRAFFAEPPSPQIVFLATGTGLAQHLCYLLSKGTLFPNLHYHLYTGVSSENEIFCEEELRQLQKSLPNFHYHFVISRGSPSWKGLRGHVQDHLHSLNLKDVETTFYLCGNGNMIKDVKHTLSQEYQVDAKKIHSEAFD